MAKQGCQRLVNKLECDFRQTMSDIVKGFPLAKKYKQILQNDTEKQEKLADLMEKEPTNPKENFIRDLSK